jgi:hypothetical protein
MQRPDRVSLSTPTRSAIDPSIRKLRPRHELPALESRRADFFPLALHINSSN